MTADNVTPLHRRVIVTKHGDEIEIPAGVEGRPIAAVFKTVPRGLKGALVYEIDGRQVIAVHDK